MLNEFRGKPYHSKLEDLYTPSTLAVNLYILLGIGLILRVLAFVMMYFISNPKRPTIKHVETELENKRQDESKEQLAWWWTYIVGPNNIAPIEANNY